VSLALAQLTQFLFLFLKMTIAGLAISGLGMSAVLKFAVPGSDALIQKLLKGVAILGGTPLLISTLAEVMKGNSLPLNKIAVPLTQ